MFESIKKTMLAGLGVAFLTKDKIEELTKEIVEKAKLSEKEARDFVDELSKKSEEARKQVKEQVEKVVKESLDRMNLATKDDIAKLEKQIHKLSEAQKKKTQD
jgi:polyhydroxyalkanoate synthesis regulator phasin